MKYENTKYENTKYENTKYENTKYENLIEKSGNDWPCELNQLHAGGWELTKTMANEIFSFWKYPSILDICCGNGSTINWISKNYSSKIDSIDGIDYSKVAIEEARQKCTDLPLFCEFYNGNLVAMPMEDDKYDVIIGQEPDALIEMTRCFMFIELHRVLRTGGWLYFTHHWIPSNTWTTTNVDDYYRQFGESHNKLSTKDYINCIIKTGFAIVDIDETFHKVAENFIRSQLKNKRERIGKLLCKDPLVIMESFLDKGFTFGIKIKCLKV